ncbi:F18 fimbrial protein FedE [Escherichia coli]|nr:F18 fimbrial protein FedE [Escherichia coli]
MIGEAFRIMKFTKIALAALMMVVIISDARATSSASALLTINVTYIKKSCDIQVPSSYNLGSLTPGRREHGDLKITWTCEGDIPYKTALIAEIVKGVVEGDNKVRLVTGTQPSGAVLSLQENDTLVTLNTTTEHDAGNYFCSDPTEGVGTRSCLVTPVTEVDQKGPFGLASATLKFSVAYP